LKITSQSGYVTHEGWSEESISFLEDLLRKHKDNIAEVIELGGQIHNGLSHTESDVKYVIGLAALENSIEETREVCQKIINKNKEDYVDFLLEVFMHSHTKKIPLSMSLTLIEAMQNDFS
jgi:hypothetical protein